MSQPRHPIDDHFRRTLEDYQREAPLHLWVDIDHRRPWHHRALQRLRRLPRRPLLLLIIGIAGAWWWLDRPAPALGSFPIPMPGTRAVLPSSAPSGRAVVEDILPATLPFHTAGPSQAPDQGKQDPAQAPTPSAPGPVAAALTLPDIDRPAPVMINAELPALLPLQDEVVLPLDPLPAPANRHTADLPVPEAGIFASDVRCARFREGRPRWFAEALVAPSMAFRELEARDPEFAHYATARERTESSLPAYQFSGRLSLVFPWGLALRTGLNYTSINERFTFIQENIKETLITEIFGPNGEVIRRDTAIVTTSQRVVTQNRHELLDLPLIAGYEFHYGQLTLAVNAGAFLNLSYRQQGRFLSPDGLSSVGFSSQDPAALPAFRPRLDVSWFGSLGFYYEINNRLDILCEPYFRIYPHSFTRRNYPLEQRYFVAGLGLGLRMAI